MTIDDSGFLEDLAARTAVQRATFNQCWAQLLDQPDARTRFTAYMVETFHYVRFTCPLLQLFEDRVRADWPDLAEYLAHHREEETDHDQWLLRDLERLGLDAERVRAKPPLRETIGLVGAQLYAIGHAPARLGHLGYIYALESSAVPAEAVDRLADRLGLPRAALSTFRAHGELDPGHEAELTDAIARFVTTPAEREAVCINAEMSLRFLSELVLAIALAPGAEIEGGLVLLSADGGAQAQPSA
jgi:pyrroloquinoline quinone (PQQ) biosynthesis protein C